MQITNVNNYEEILHHEVVYDIDTSVDLKKWYSMESDFSFDDAISYIRAAIETEGSDVYYRIVERVYKKHVLPSIYTIDENGKMNIHEPTS
jgi:hypothetical protein